MAKKLMSINDIMGMFVVSASTARRIMARSKIDGHKIESDRLVKAWFIETVKKAMGKYGEK